MATTSQRILDLISAIGADVKTLLASSKAPAPGAFIQSGQDAMAPFVRVGANAGMTTPTAPGVFWAYPYDINVPTSITAVVIQVGTAVVPGTATVSAKLAFWNDAGGKPDLANGPIFTSPVDLTTTGKKVMPWVTTLPTARYWCGFLYLCSAAPTTIPSVYLVNSASWNLSLPVASSFANAVCGWKWTGVSDFPTSMTGMATFAASNEVPIIALRGA